MYTFFNNLNLMKNTVSTKIAINDVSSLISVDDEFYSGTRKLAYPRFFSGKLTLLPVDTYYFMNEWRVYCFQRSK